LIDLTKLTKTPKKYARELTKKEAKSLLDSLDKAYFISSKPLVSDAIYDTFRQAIESKYPDLMAKVGSVDDSDVELPAPMASLNQYKLDSSKLKSALKKRTKYVISSKLDGLSIELVYEKGVLKKAFTRGDAVMGKDVSRHISAMGVPKKLATPTDLIVRTECLIRTETFKKHMTKDAGGKYTAARNAASGLIRKFTSDAMIKHLSFVAFEIIGGEGSGTKLSAQLLKLKRMGFYVVYHEVVTAPMTQDTLVSTLERFMASSEFELDGIVVAEDVPYQNSDENPTHAFKFKMNSDADAVLVPIKEIVYNHTKLGYLQPVVTFEPTIIDGVTVERASAHNGFYVEHGYLKDEKNPGPKKPLGPGAIIKVVRSGKVIPYITEVIKGAKKPELPKVEFERKGVEFTSVGESSEVEIRRMSHFVSSLSIEGFASGSVAKVFDALGEWSKEDAIENPGSVADVLGKAVSQKFVKAVNALKRNGVKADVWYLACSPWYFEGASDSTYSALLDSNPEVITCNKTAQVKTVTAMIQSSTRVKTKAQDLAKAIIEMNRDAKLLGLKLLVPDKVEVTGSALKGQSIAFTGVRDAALKTAIIAAGGEAKDSMTSATTILIAKDPGDSSAKLEKARAKGIEIMSITSFKKRYGL
jgi:NAD-dependent DNA ligase